MLTSELIDALAGQTPPVRSSSVQRVIGSGLLLGAGVSLLVLGLAYGVRSDLSAAVLSTPFWMKWTYAVAVALNAYILCEHLARPGGRVARRLAFVCAPIFILALVAAISLWATPATARRAAWLGHSALVCPWNIGFLSLPIFAALCWVIRRAAPTRLRWAGFAAGLLSGAAAAFIYGLYCNESAVPFVSTWYTLGMLLPAFLGAAFGPKLLRWQ